MSDKNDTDDFWFWAIIAIVGILLFGEFAAALIILFLLWLILMEVTRK